MRAGLVLGEQRGRGRLDGHQLHVLLVAAQGAAGAGNGAAGADARDEVIDVAVGVLPNLLAGGGGVDLRVGLVDELGGEDSVVGVGHDLVGLLHRTAHALGARGEHQLGAEGAEDDAALLAHGVGHREDHLVTAGGTDQGQGDAGVAGGALDDGAARLQLAGLLGGVDDGLADAVLDAVGRVVELQLRDDGAGQALGNAVQLHQRGAADEVGDVLVDGHPGCPFGSRVRRWASLQPVAEFVQTGWSSWQFVDVQCRTMGR